jgi:hypothetical protein
MERLLDYDAAPSQSSEQLDIARTSLNLVAIAAIVLCCLMSLAQAATGQPMALVRGFGFLFAVEMAWLVGTISILHFRR